MIYASIQILVHELVLDEYCLIIESIAGEVLVVDFVLLRIITKVVCCLFLNVHTILLILRNYLITWYTKVYGLVLIRFLYFAIVEAGTHWVYFSFNTARQRFRRLLLKLINFLLMGKLRVFQFYLDILVLLNYLAFFRRVKGYVLDKSILQWLSEIVFRHNFLIYSLLLINLLCCIEVNIIWYRWAYLNNPCLTIYS